MRRSLWLMLFATASLAAWSLRKPALTPVVAAADIASVDHVPAARSSAAISAWPEVEVEPALANPFVVNLSAPTAAVTVVAAPAPAAEPPPAIAPAVAHRFFGRVVGPDGQLLTLLTRTGVPVAVSDGMALDDGYVVEAVRSDAVRLVYPPLGVLVELPLPPPPSEPRP
jgi:hypothetical protein